MLALLSTFAVLAAAPDAAAADRLAAEGVALGEAGQYRAAIDRFHAAERAAPRAIHDCNIALAWIGLESPHRAWFFLDRCRRRATEPLPAWVEAQHRDLTARLDAGGHALLTVETDPPGAELLISVLEAEAAARSPARLYVPLGAVEIRARLANHGEVLERLTVEAASPRVVRLTLPRPRVVVVAPPPPPAAVESVAPPPADDDTAAWITLGVGASAAVAGTGFFFGALGAQSEAESASARGDAPGLADARDRTRLREGLAYGLWAVGAIGVATGAWMMLDDGPAVGLVPGGVVLGGRWP
ncbi:MAG: hypothetical protein H6706_19930 [Myxococcales bacterium]|nr:hypothetical protein [Myxococcales bacterium]